MNKSELTAALAERTGLPKTKAAEAVNALFAPADGIIASTCRGGEKVTVPGFGTWQQKTQAARKGVNPSTGAPLDIPEKQVIKFSSGKGLKG
jgi:DNA-binding protein HU-beta